MTFRSRTQKERPKAGVGTAEGIWEVRIGERDTKGHRKVECTLKQGTIKAPETPALELPSAYLEKTKFMVFDSAGAIVEMGPKEHNDAGSQPVPSAENVAVDVASDSLWVQAFQVFANRSSYLKPSLSVGETWPLDVKLPMCRDTGEGQFREIRREGDSRLAVIDLTLKAA